jgi:hypothetical protein
VTPALIPEEKIAEVKAFNPYVSAQLEMQWGYDLRTKESIMCQPHLAQVRADRVPSHICDPVVFKNSTASAESLV